MTSKQGLPTLYIVRPFEGPWKDPRRCEYFVERYDRFAERWDALVPFGGYLTYYRIRDARAVIETIHAETGTPFEIAP